MVKKFFIMVVLLAATAVTVLFGEGFDLSFLYGTSTAVATETLTIAATQTQVITETEEPTATVTFTSTLDYTETPETAATATQTSIPTETPTNTPTNTATPSPTAISELFSVQTGSPVYMPNFAHPTEGCAWQGVAGQVFGSDSLPLVNYIVKISGTFNGVSVNQIGLTGLVANKPYGPGSYEFVIGNTAQDTQNQLTLQLFDTDGQEVSAPVAINTYASCSKNLEIINFKQN